MGSRTALCVYGRTPRSPCWLWAPCWAHLPVKPMSFPRPHVSTWGAHVQTGDGCWGPDSGAGQAGLCTGSLSTSPHAPSLTGSQAPSPSGRGCLPCPETLVGPRLATGPQLSLGRGSPRTSARTPPPSSLTCSSQVTGGQCSACPAWLGPTSTSASGGVLGSRRYGLCSSLCPGPWGGPLPGPTSPQCSRPGSGDLLCAYTLCSPDHHRGAALSPRPGGRWGRCPRHITASPGPSPGASLGPSCSPEATEATEARAVGRWEQDGLRTGSPGPRDRRGRGEG